jgi:hypothetical protein
LATGNWQLIPLFLTRTKSTLSMRVKLLAQISLLFLFVASASPLIGQEVLLGDQHYPQATAVNTDRGPALPLRTAAALSLPFFEDFSQDSLRPTIDNWLVYSVDPKVPGISNHKGVAAPSKGVCTFDGATFGGRKYKVDLETGINDTLTSLDIDLSSKSIADSVYLSFFMQRGGGGESPEITDSIVVLFDTSGNFEYEKVWALKGGVGAEKTFNYYEIVLDKANYFHSAFRFKFVCYGSLNGEFDQFHLDYILLDEGRSSGDDAFNDVSPSRILQSPFYPHTALPREQYQQGGYTSDMRFLISNAANPTMTSPTSGFAITDASGNNTLSGTTTSTPSVSQLIPFAKDTVISPAFTDQGTNFVDYGTLRMTVNTTASGDAFAGNNSLSKDYPIDTLMGYDDGVADFGYGITSAKSLCQRYTLSRADTLTALWINFSPSIHYNNTNNQSTCLDNKSFKIAIWDTLAPDSFLTQASQTVSYDSSLNDFVRYPFIRPLVVKGTFYVGLQQSDGMPIGIGWDSDGPSGYTFFEDVSGAFIASGNSGCMMIRPEFGVNSDFISGRQPASEDPGFAVQIAPQPWQEGPLRVSLKGSEPIREVHATMITLQGQEIFRQDIGANTGNFSLNLPPTLSPGIYILRLDGLSRSGEAFSIRRRLPVQSAR